MTKILIIEDEQTAREALASFLRRKGFIVIEAQDGKKGIDILSNDKFDIILSDLRTPTLDSITLLHQLGIYSKGADIVIMTAHLSNLTLFKSGQINVTAYIEKPFTLEYMFKIVEGIIKNRAKPA